MSDDDENNEEVQAAAEDFMDLDEKFWDSANECLVLDEVAMCDEFEEFSKLANNDSTTLHGQLFKNCWSLICCSVSHEIHIRKYYVNSFSP